MAMLAIPSFASTHAESSSAGGEKRQREQKMKLIGEQNLVLVHVDTFNERRKCTAQGRSTPFQLTRGNESPPLTKIQS